MTAKPVPWSSYLDALAETHHLGDRVAYRLPTFIETDRLTYTFGTHFHPFVRELVEALNEGSVAGLQDQDTGYLREPPETGPVVQLDGKPRPILYEDTFKQLYEPGTATATPYPVKELDFDSSGAYSVYNWELFYHLPMAVAVHLSGNGRYEEAQRWFHFVFDPTDDSGDPAPERFWKAKPLRTADVRKIEELLVNLSTGANAKLRSETIRNIADWQDNPFRPHRVARVRITPYMYKAVTAYLDNLIDWGDSLFRQDTGEAINEATQLYVLAANILGPRPQAVPRKGWQRPQSYAELRGDLDAFGDALRELEAELPFDLAPRAANRAAHGKLAILRGLGATLYFGVPRNDTMLGYWDTVADRLFKIRNSLNLQGIFRQLPLFEPPIDPALLARAAASGVDVGAVVAGLRQPLPLVRFSLLVARAAEICQEVKSLGAQLLAATEKQDNEHLAVLRAQHETAILRMVETVRYSQLQEATKTREALEQSLANATAKYHYYQRQLRVQDKDLVSPVVDEVDAASLTARTFASTEQTVPTSDVVPNIAADLGASGGKIVSSHERSELGKLGKAHVAQEVAHGLDALRGALSLIPQFEVAGKPIGVGGAVGFGGKQLADGAAALASVARAVAEKYSYEANLSGKIGGYARREQDWAFQSNGIAGELTQILKQLRAAQIRVAIAEQEWRNHQRQIANAEAIEQFLTDERTGRTTSEGFYTYLKREVRRLYTQGFDFAFDIARKAERALQHELGNPSATFLGQSYLAGREGLLAGEKLYLDVKRMELAYHELNAREYELTTHVSLRKLDPLALLQLRTTGRATVRLPEEWFDLDCPGHYFRRIKSVAVSIPCVVGPYATVNCTLTQLSSSIRTSPRLAGGLYPRQGDDVERFSDHAGAVQSIVTSTGQNDSGLFETNLRDERYLPFEGTGAIGDWQLDLPADVPQFDHETIADVVLHVRYTAREGGDPLRTKAVQNLVAAVEAASTAGSVRLLSARQEFPSEWARFKAAKIGGAAATAPLTCRLREEHYPYWSRKVDPVGLRRVDLFVQPGPDPLRTVTVSDDSGGTASLTADPSFGDLLTGQLPDPMPAATGTFTRQFDDNSMADIWLALTWGKG